MEIGPNLAGAIQLVAVMLVIALGIWTTNR